MRTASFPILTACCGRKRSGSWGKAYNSSFTRVMWARLEFSRSSSVIARCLPVRGNVDTEKWAEELPPTMVVKISGFHFYVLHISATWT